MNTFYFNDPSFSKIALPNDGVEIKVVVGFQYERESLDINKSSFVEESMKTELKHY